MWDRTRLRKPRYVSYTHVTINWVTLVDRDVQDDKVSVDNKNVSLTWDFFFRRQFITVEKFFAR